MTAEFSFIHLKPLKFRMTDKCYFESYFVTISLIRF